MRRWIPLLLLCACSNREVRLDLPIEPDHRALVLAVEDADQLDVYAIDLEGDHSPLLQTLIPSYIGAYEVRLTALLYRRPLRDYSLTAGAMLAVTEQPMRRIPIATSTLTAVVRGEEIGDWLAVDSPSEPVDAFRIPSVQIDECLDQGGCFEHGSSQCLLPCPPAAEPDPPLPPVIPTASCAPSWEDVEVKPGVAACTPWISAAPTCTGSNTIFPGESACHPLGPGCPAGTWQTNLPPGPRFYVQAGATGGDGSEGAPLGTIQAAINLALGGEVVIIAAGVYREQVHLDAAVTLIGACPEETIIDGTGSRAINAEVGGSAVENLTITGDNAGVEVDSGASIRLTDVVIADTAGNGINITQAGRIELERVSIKNAEDTGIWVQSRGVVEATKLEVTGARGALGVDRAIMRITDGLIRDSRPHLDGTFGRGVNVQNDADATFRRTVFENHFDLGVFVSSARAELDRVVVRGTKSRPSDDGSGFGVIVQNGGVVTIRNSWLHENHETNLYAIGRDGTDAIVEDSILSNALISGNGGGGINAQIIGGASAHFARVVAIDPRYTSISVGDAGEVHFEDLTILGAGINDRLQAGDGLHIQGDALVTVERMRIDDAQAQAINVIGNMSRATLSDVAINRAGNGDCFFCSGICLDGSAKVEPAVRISIDQARGTGVTALEVQARFVASHLVVTRTDRSATCVLNHPVRNVGRGVGVYATDGGQIDLSHFRLSQNIESGAQVAQFLPLAEGTALDLADGIINDNPTGATILIDPYDVRRLAERVVYSNNDTNLNFSE